MTRSFRTTAAGVLAAAMAATALPVLIATPAQAALVTLTPEEAIDALQKASGVSTDTLSKTGGRSNASIGFSFGGQNGFSIGQEATVDPTRRSVRLITTGLGSSPIGGGSFDSEEVCAPDTGSYDPNREVIVYKERAGVYTSLGAKPNPTVKSALRILKTPNARWERRSDSTPFGAVVYGSDLAQLALFTLEDAQLLSATRGSGTGGFRYTIDYRSAGTPGTAVFDVNPQGALAVLTLTESDSFAQSRIYSRYTFGAQSVLTPVASQTITRSKLVPGCRAALTKSTVIDTARSVARDLNLRARNTGTKVSVAAIRNRTTKALAGDSFKLVVRDNDIANGVRITGSHPKLKKPVNRRVLVKKGKAVVRKGR